MVVGCFFINVIGGYSWLLVAISWMAIGGYSINGYWWLFYYWLLVVILLMTIGGLFY